MQHLPTALLIIAAVIAFNGGETAHQDDMKADQIADGSKNRTVDMNDSSQIASAFAYGDLQEDGSHHPRIMRIKHRHHRYLKSVEKLVNIPFKAEVPRSYPNPVEDKVPVVEEKIKIVETPVRDPVTVTVPHPVQVTTPHTVQITKLHPVQVTKPHPVQVTKPLPVQVTKPLPVQVTKPQPVQVTNPHPVQITKPRQVQVTKQHPVQVTKPQPVQVTKPQPVQVTVPHPVQVTKRHPVQDTVPHPVPHKVNEKDYVSKPYPMGQHILKQVDVKVPPAPVTMERRVPDPAPVTARVSLPYPVETRVPYPHEVKLREPVKVVKHVQVKNPYPQTSVSDDVKSAPSQVGSVHGNTGFAGFQSLFEKRKMSAESSEKTDTSAEESLNTTETTSSIERSDGINASSDDNPTQVSVSEDAKGFEINTEASTTT